MTPGQAAYEAYMAAIGLTPYLPGDNWASHADEHRGWEAAGQAAIDAYLAPARGPWAERAAEILTEGHP